MDVKLMQPGKTMSLFLINQMKNLHHLWTTLHKETIQRPILRPCCLAWIIFKALNESQGLNNSKSLSTEERGRRWETCASAKPRQSTRMKPQHRVNGVNGGLVSYGTKTPHFNSTWIMNSSWAYYLSPSLNCHIAISFLQWPVVSSAKLLIPLKR